jgi:hypothetical protein
MLFRRVREHVRSHDWFAVAVDFLIVVLGIFAGLQVDNWNETRKDRALEQEYLERLYDDAVETIERNEDMRQFLLGHAERAGIVLEALRTCDLDPSNRDDFATGLFQLGKLFPPYMADGTLMELRSTGNLALLQSDTIRQQMDQAIAQYVEFERVWSQITGRVIPPVNYVDRLVAYTIEQEMRGNVAIGWEQLEMDFRAACGDRRLYNSVAAVRNYTYDVAAWLRLTGQAFAQLQDALAQEIYQSSGSVPKQQVR